MEREHADERLHIALVALFDTQFLLWLLLHTFLSPLPRLFFADLSNTMQDPTLRFFGMEHEIAMLTTTAIIHIGRVRSRRMGTSAVRHHRVWVTTLLTLLIILAAIP